MWYGRGLRAAPGRRLRLATASARTGSLRRELSNRGEEEAAAHSSTSMRSARRTRRTPPSSPAPPPAPTWNATVTTDEPKSASNLQQSALEAGRGGGGARAHCVLTRAPRARAAARPPRSAPRGTAWWRAPARARCAAPRRRAAAARPRPADTRGCRAPPARHTRPASEAPKRIQI